MIDMSLNTIRTMKLIIIRQVLMINTRVDMILNSVETNMTISMKVNITINMMTTMEIIENKVDMKKHMKDKIDKADNLETSIKQIDMSKQTNMKEDLELQEIEMIDRTEDRDIPASTNIMKEKMKDILQTLEKSIMMKRKTFLIMT